MQLRDKIAVAQALVPAVSRLVSTGVAGLARCRAKSVPMSGDAGGRRACATFGGRFGQILVGFVLFACVTGAAIGGGARRAGVPAPRSEADLARYSLASCSSPA